MFPQWRIICRNLFSGGNFLSYTHILTAIDCSYSAFIDSYFNGKRRAEQALLDAYPDSGIVLRPGFIYGTRELPVEVPAILKPIVGSKLALPLWLLGQCVAIHIYTAPLL